MRLAYIMLKTICPMYKVEMGAAHEPPKIEPVLEMLQPCLEEWSLPPKSKAMSRNRLNHAGMPPRFPKQEPHPNYGGGGDRQPLPSIGRGRGMVRVRNETRLERDLDHEWREFGEPMPRTSNGSELSTSSASFRPDWSQAVLMSDALASPAPSSRGLSPVSWQLPAQRAQSSGGTVPVDPRSRASQYRPY